MRTIFARILAFFTKKKQQPVQSKAQPVPSLYALQQQRSWDKINEITPQSRPAPRKTEVRSQRSATSSAAPSKTVYHDSSNDGFVPGYLLGAASQTHTPICHSTPSHGSSSHSDSHCHSSAPDSSGSSGSFDSGGSFD